MPIPSATPSSRPNWQHMNSRALLPAVVFTGFCLESSELDLRMPASQADLMHGQALSGALLLLPSPHQAHVHRLMTIPVPPPMHPLYLLPTSPGRCEHVCLCFGCWCAWFAIQYLQDPMMIGAGRWMWNARVSLGSRGMSGWFDPWILSGKRLKLTASKNSLFLNDCLRDDFMTGEESQICMWKYFCKCLGRKT